MNASRLSTLLLMLTLLPACGRQLVEFERDRGNPDPDGPPTVIAVVPQDDATQVPLDTDITATFSKAMNPATLSATTFTVMHGTTSLQGVVTYDTNDETASFAPDAPLVLSRLYTATITTGAQDTDGVALEASFPWSFTTGDSAAEPPVVVSTTPLNLATNVALGKRPTATFSEPMSPASINFLTFTVELAGVPIPGTVTLDTANNLVAMFTPDEPLDVGVVYTATITTGAEDAANTALEEDYLWTFTTGACGMEPVDLGSSANFAVLAGQTVTNTGALTIVTGDVGTSPGTAITGFALGEGTIIGAQHAGDAVALTAMGDLTTAYNEVAGRSLCAITVADNIGGTTLAPGLYKSTSTLAISSGELTLDAQGDADAIWIFQMASSLTVTSGRKVILTNGATASNVYWQVGSAATLGTTVEFNGTIMAEAAITLETGATLNGRALVMSDAVTLDSNTVTTPAP